MNNHRISKTLLGFTLSLILFACASGPVNIESSSWARATLKKLTLRQKIAQMMVYHMNLDYRFADAKHWQEIRTILDTDGMGSVLVWGGESTASLSILNEMQRRSRVPILVTADLEYGLKGRFDVGTEVPWPMALAATGDPDLAYEAGRITAVEGRALGIHLALAPVVDVNNNPQNPIINTRAFSEDPDQVSRYAKRFVDGLQSHNMLATAKHFPGHGDTQTDSHSRLAKIPEDSTRLWSVELKPFQDMIDGGIDVVMSGHLDAGEFQMEPGIPSSLSPFWLQDVLRKKMGFKGVVITDAMAMGGIVNKFSDRYALIQTIKAGSDLIIQNYDYRGSIDFIEEAVHDGLLTEARIDESVLRILTLKSKIGLDKQKLTDLPAMHQALASEENLSASKTIMTKAVTLVRDSLNVVPFNPTHKDTVYVIDVNDHANDHDMSTVRAYLNKSLPYVESYVVDNTDPQAYYETVLNAIPDSARVIVNVFSRIKMKKDRVSLPEIQSEFIRSIHSKTPNLLVTSLGTPYVIDAFPQVPAYMVCFSSQRSMQKALASAIVGQANISGTLPISIPGIASRGDGIKRDGNVMATAKTMVTAPEDEKILFHVSPEEVGADPGRIMPHIHAALKDSAWPGGVLLAAKDGKIFMHEYFGNHTYTSDRQTYRGDIFDLASVTKVIATTSAAMKLYEEGKLNLDTTVVSYLPHFANPDSVSDSLKRVITVKNLLTHTAGMQPFRRFFAMEAPSQEALWDSVFDSALDTIPGTKYRYSDIGLITLGKIIEKQAGTDLKTFTDSVIFDPLEMTATGYLPEYPLNRIVPTEFSWLDSSLIHGYVHDENSHSLGGITGHAGLFSTSSDLARFAQMMLNKGVLGDVRIFKPETIELFTQRANMLEEYNSRCLGWDSPEGISSGGAYISINSFGHTGYTGTSIWIDPDNQIFVILLTNAVHPYRSYKYPNYFDWRQRIHASVYESLGFTEITPKVEWRDRWLKEQKRQSRWWYKLFHRKH